MTDTVEFRVDSSEYKDGGMFVVEQVTKDGVEFLDDFVTYEEAHSFARGMAEACVFDESIPVRFPLWDPPSEYELDDELDEDDSPVFAPGTRFNGPTLAVDENGNPWWIDPFQKTLKRAG